MLSTDQTALSQTFLSKTLVQQPSQKMKTFSSSSAILSFLFFAFFTFAVCAAPPASSSMLLRNSVDASFDSIYKTLDSIKDALLSATNNPEAIQDSIGKLLHLDSVTDPVPTTVEANALLTALMEQLQGVSPETIQEAVKQIMESGVHLERLPVVGHRLLDELSNSLKSKALDHSIRLKSEGKDEETDAAVQTAKEEKTEVVELLRKTGEKIVESLLGPLRAASDVLPLHIFIGPMNQILGSDEEQR